jgi:hypothetical protein
MVVPLSYCPLSVSRKALILIQASIGSLKTEALFRTQEQVQNAPEVATFILKATASSPLLIRFINPKEFERTC